MEAKKEELIITREWLKEHGACENYLNFFLKHYSKTGVKILDLLKKCDEVRRFNFINWLISNVPFNNTVLEVDNIDGNLFYNGDVHVKGDIHTSGLVYIKGKLIVDKEIYLKSKGRICAKQIEVPMILLKYKAHIYGKIKTTSIRMYDDSVIVGDVIAHTINIEGCNASIECNQVKAINIDLIDGHIWGDVDAKLIINCRGVIHGNVLVDKIELKYGGKVEGITTFKSALSSNDKQK